MSDSGRRRMRVLFMCLGVLMTYENTYSELIHELKERADYYQQVQLPNMAIHDLKDDYNVVFVNAEVMTKPKYSAVWAAVVEFVHLGGLAICLGDFNKVYTRISDTNPPVDSDDLPNPFAIAGLPWKFDDKYSCTVFLNDKYIPLPDRHLADLPDSYRLNAVFLTDVDIADAWYRSTSIDIAFPEVEVEPHHYNPRVNPWSFPLVRTEVGRGRIGYVGEVGIFTPVSVIMAMAGFPAMPTFPA